MERTQLDISAGLGMSREDVGRYLRYLAQDKVCCVAIGVR